MSTTSTLVAYTAAYPTWEDLRKSHYFRVHRFKCSNRALAGVHPIPNYELQFLRPEERLELIQQVHHIERNWNWNGPLTGKFRFSQTRCHLQLLRAYDERNEQIGKNGTGNKPQKHAPNHNEGDAPHTNQNGENTEHLQGGWVHMCDESLEKLPPCQEIPSSGYQYDVYTTSTEDLLRLADSYQRSADESGRKLGYLQPQSTRDALEASLFETISPIQTPSKPGRPASHFKIPPPLIKKTGPSTPPRAPRPPTPPYEGDFEAFESARVHACEYSPEKIPLLITSWKFSEDGLFVPSTPTPRGDGRGRGTSGASRYERAVRDMRDLRGVRGDEPIMGRSWEVLWSRRATRASQASRPPEGKVDTDSRRKKNDLVLLDKAAPADVDDSLKPRIEVLESNRKPDSDQKISHASEEHGCTNIQSSTGRQICPDNDGSPEARSHPESLQEPTDITPEITHCIIPPGPDNAKQPNDEAIHSAEDNPPSNRTTDPSSTLSHPPSSNHAQPNTSSPLTINFSIPDPTGHLAAQSLQIPLSDPPTLHSSRLLTTILAAQDALDWAFLTYIATLPFHRLEIPLGVNLALGLLSIGARFCSLCLTRGSTFTPRCWINVGITRLHHLLKDRPLKLLKMTFLSLVLAVGILYIAALERRVCRSDAPPELMMMSATGADTAVHASQLGSTMGPNVPPDMVFGPNASFGLPTASCPSGLALGSSSGGVSRYVWTKDLRREYVQAGVFGILMYQRLRALGVIGWTGGSRY